MPVVVFGVVGTPPAEVVWPAPGRSGVRELRPAPAVETSPPDSPENSITQSQHFQLNK